MSLAEFLKSLGHGCIDVFRQNKLAASFSLIAFCVTVLLSVYVKYDERPRYREVILPGINRAESQFLDDVKNARNASDEQGRIAYFVDAYRKAQEVSVLLNSRKPQTEEAKRAHGNLILYYELVSEEFANILSRMSIDSHLDYLGAWEKSAVELEPIRKAWVNWVGAGL